VQATAWYNGEYVGNHAGNWHILNNFQSNVQCWDGMGILNQFKLEQHPTNWRYLRYVFHCLMFDEPWFKDKFTCDPYEITPAQSNGNWRLIFMDRQAINCGPGRYLAHQSFVTGRTDIYTGIYVPGNYVSYSYKCCYPEKLV